MMQQADSIKPPLLEVRMLSYGYGGSVVPREGALPATVLNALDFAVGEGEKVAVVGANGAGKSTLLQLLAGCLEPVAGEIRLDGEVLRHDQPAARRRIGMVFQDADDQLFMPTVWEDIAFGLAGHGIPTAMLKDKARQVLQSLHAEHLLERPPHQLSGGEKRVAALATVLALSPRLAVLDEPTAALDPRARKRLMALLKAMPEALVIATHDLDMALEVCDRVLVLHEGRIVHQGPVPGCLADAVFLHACGLELPLRYEYAGAAGN